MKIEYQVDVINEEQIKEAIFAALKAGIKTMDEKELPSFTMGFHFMGKFCSILVKESERIN